MVPGFLVLVAGVGLIVLVFVCLRYVLLGCGFVICFCCLVLV